MRRWLLCNVLNRHLWVRLQLDALPAAHDLCWYCGRSAPNE